MYNLLRSGSCVHTDILIMHKWIRHVRFHAHTQTRGALWSGPDPGTLWLCICYAEVNKCSCGSHGLNNQSFPQFVNPPASGSKMVNCCNWSHPAPLLTPDVTLSVFLSVFLLADTHALTPTDNTPACTHARTHTHAQARHPTVWGAAATFTPLNVIPGLNASLRV